MHYPVSGTYNKLVSAIPETSLNNERSVYVNKQNSRSAIKEAIRGNCK